MLHSKTPDLLEKEEKEKEMVPSFKRNLKRCGRESDRNG